MEMTKLVAFINKQSIRAYLAMGVIIFSLTYLGVVSFVKIPKENINIVVLIIGYIMGLATMILSYYFGSNKKADDTSDSQQ